MPVSRDALADLCAEAGEETLVGFVADCYEARGRTVEHLGDRRLAVATEDSERVVAVVPPGTGDVALPDDVDTVVVPGEVGDTAVTDGATAASDDTAETTAASDDPAEPVDVRDVTDLHEQLLYALDRETASGILARRFDCAPADLASPGPIRGDFGGEAPQGAERSDGDLGPGVSTVLAADGTGWTLPLAGVLVLCLVGAVVVGLSLDGPAPTAGSGTPTPGSQLSQTPSATPAATDRPSRSGQARSQSAAAETVRRPRRRAVQRSRRTLTADTGFTGEQFAAATGAVTSPPASGNLPPGLAVTGALNETRLAARHAALLRDGSYQVVFAYRELDGGNVTGRYVEVINVVNDTEYAVWTRENGTLRRRQVGLVGHRVYANGSVRFDRVAGGVRTTTVTASDPFADDVERYLTWLLSTGDARITGWVGGEGERTYRVQFADRTFPMVFAGTESGSMVEASATAFVTERGVVKSVRREYRRLGTDRKIVVVFGVTGTGFRPIGDRPAWVDRERE